MLASRPRRPAATALCFLVLAVAAFAQNAGTGRGQAPATPYGGSPPPLLFKEVWREQPGATDDVTQRFSPYVVTNAQIEVKLYGTDSATIRAANHEGRVDLWTGMATSPVAVTLRHRKSYVDLTELARLRWIVRTNAIHTLHPVVKLPDGMMLAGDRGISTGNEFLQVDISFNGMRWWKLDPKKVVISTLTSGEVPGTTSEVRNPDLSKVDEVGLVMLAPGGGHGIAASANLSTVELYAKPVAR